MFLRDGSPVCAYNTIEPSRSLRYDNRVRVIVTDVIAQLGVVLLHRISRTYEHFKKLVSTKTTLGTVRAKQEALESRPSEQ